MRVYAVLATAVAAAVLSVSPAAAQGVTVADWQMNEPASANTMTDSSPNGITGTIGDLVSPGGGAYNFRPHWTVTPSRRLVLVGDDDRLEPGSGYFSVEMRFRTTKAEQNIVQKGQAHARGGYWKIAMAQQGRIVCHFRDGNRNNLAVRPRKVQVHDGAWHTILCERTATGVAMTIDGVRSFHRGNIGPVNNRAELMIGGKLNCNWSDIGCDPFVGQIDYVTVRQAPFGSGTR